MALPQERPRRTAEDWWALPEGARTELIDGEFWDLASPSRTHQRIVYELSREIGNFIRAHGGPCEVNVAPFAVDLFADGTTIVEPDVLVVCDRAKLTDRGCDGAPDLVVEVVSPSNPGMDYITKLSYYQAAGVREYWICDPRQAVTYVYDLAGEGDLSSYPFAEPATSTVLPGFEMTFAEVVAAL